MENTKVKKELLSYFLITFIVSWLLWLPAILNSYSYRIMPVFLFISMFASFTPSVVGLVLNRRYMGSDKFKKYFKRSLSLKFSKKWFVYIAFFFFLLAFISYRLMLMLLSDFKIINPIPIIMTPLIFIQILLIGGAIGEEFGWRGFAQYRFDKITSPFISSLLIGLLWSLWHLPLFFIIGTVQASIPIWQFMIQNLLISFFYTWFYKKSDASIVLMIFLHAILNTSAAIFPYWQNNLGRYIGFTGLLVSCLALYRISPLGTRKST